MSDPMKSIFVTFLPVEGWYLLAPIISTISTAMVVISCIREKKHKETLGFMVLMINLADLHFCASKLLFSALDWTYGRWSCPIYDGINHFGLLASVIWGAFFGHALLQVARAQRIEVLEKSIKTYKLIGLFVPLVIAGILPFTEYAIYYEADTKLCVHYFTNTDQYPGSNLSYIFLAQVPIGVVCALSLIWYTKAYKQLRSLEVEGNMITLIFYPAIIIVCWAPILVSGLFFMSLGTVGDHKRLLSAFEAVGQLQGFLDAVIYGGGPKLFKKLCQCRKRNRKDPATQALVASYREDDSFKHEVSSLDDFKENAPLPEN